MGACANMTLFGMCKLEALACVNTTAWRPQNGDRKFNLKKNKGYEPSIQRTSCDDMCKYNWCWLTGAEGMRPHGASRSWLFAMLAIAMTNDTSFPVQQADKRATFCRLGCQQGCGGGMLPGCW